MLGGICQDIVDPSLKVNYAITSFTLELKNTLPGKDRVIKRGDKFVS